MKVILLRDVANLGRKFDVVEVSDGFALNKLIPKNQALAASSENIKKLTSKRDKLAEIHETKQDEFKSVLAAFKEEIVTIKTKMNDQGHLFQTLKVAQVIDALKEHGVNLNVEEIRLPESIKQAGKHEITLVSGKVTAKLNINIINV